MTARSNTFASRYPPDAEKHPEAKAAWDAMVLNFYKCRLEECNAGLKRGLWSQDQWWALHGHTVSEAKRHKTMKKPSAATTGQAAAEGEDAQAPPASAEVDEHEENDHEGEEEQEEEEKEDAEMHEEGEEEEMDEGAHPGHPCGDA